jgi:ubiquinone/menaquinone biosynthesis C-methylase UbiE
MPSPLRRVSLTSLQELGYDILLLYWKRMESRKFDPKKLEVLNDPKRLKMLNPDLIWETVSVRNPEVLVDIGAGTGFFAVPFAGKMKKGKIYACDVSDTMLEWMGKNLPRETKGIVIPLKMEESSVPLSDGIADLVYMINLHHELEEPEKVVGEAFRLLKHGGKLMAIDWKKEETQEGPPLSIRVTEGTIKEHMRKAGFVHITTYNVLQFHNFVVGEKN